MSHPPDDHLARAHTRRSLDPTGDETLQYAREQVLTRLREDHRFLLAAHEGLDGDAIGSLIALHGLLSGLGKHSSISPKSCSLRSTATGR